MKTERSAKLKSVASAMKIVLGLRRKNKFEGDPDNSYFEDEVLEISEKVLKEVFEKIMQRHYKKLEDLQDHFNTTVDNYEEKLKEKDRIIDNIQRK